MKTPITEAKTLLRYLRKQTSCKRKNFSPSCPDCRIHLLTGLLGEFIDVHEWIEKNGSVRKITWDKKTTDKFKKKK